MICQYMFSNCNNCTALVVDIYNGGGYTYVGIRKYLYLPFSLAVNLKLL